MLLDRLAVTVGGCKENVTGKAKNHRNFVFAAVSPEKELPNVPETKVGLTRSLVHFSRSHTYLFFDEK